MSFEDLYAASVEAGIQQTLANPGPGSGEPTSFSAKALLSAGVKGVPRGALEMGASFLDLLAPAQAEVARRPKLKANRDQPDDSDRVASDARLLAEGAEAARTKAETFAPDPTTATTAEQVLHGFTRVATKVAIATAGTPGLPEAAVVLGAEGTNTAYRELRGRGIDPATALKAATIEGAGQAAAVIPLAGSTIPRTAALTALGGPVTFASQEALSRKILAQAGYANEAARHDPLDPVGLGVATLVPGVFGAAHAIKLARRPTLAEVVLSNESGGRRYGADGQLLTSPKGAQGEMQVMPKTATDPGFGVVPARDNSPEELARVGRDYLDAMVHRYGRADQAMAAYNAGPGAVDKAMVQAAKDGSDWLSHLPKETQDYVAKGMKKLGDDNVAAAAQDPAAVDAARVRTTEAARMRSMPADIEAPARVLEATDAIAAGDRAAAERAALGRAYDSVWENPTGDRLDPIVHITPENIEATAIARGGFKGKGDIEVQGSGFGLVKFIWKHGEESSKDPEFQIRRDDVVAFPDVIRRYEPTERDAGGATAREWRVNTDDGRQVVYADTKVGDDRHVVTMYVQEPGKPGDGTPASKQRPDWSSESRSKLFEAGAADTPPGLLHLSGQNQSGERIVPRAPGAEATNALPPHDRVAAERQPASKAGGQQTADSNADPAVSARVKALAEQSPEMKVQLPGSDQTLSVEAALQAAKEAHALEMTDTKLVQAALDCALGFGA